LTLHSRDERRALEQHLGESLESLRKGLVANFVSEHYLSSKIVEKQELSNEQTSACCHLLPFGRADEYEVAGLLLCEPLAELFFSAVAS
jgi:hypothetical protein